MGVPDARMLEEMTTPTMFPEESLDVWALVSSQQVIAITLFCSTL